MAQYIILTSREQEVGLTYAFDNFAAEGQTKEQFLQERVSHQVLNPMVIDRANAVSIALDRSIITIPEANEAKASAEIQAVILANGGTLVPVSRPIPTGVIVPPFTLPPPLPPAPPPLPVPDSLPPIRS